MGDTLRAGLARTAAALRSGDFVTRGRLRAAAVLLLIYGAASFAAAYGASPDGLRDPRGVPFGPDMLAFWTAGRLAAEGGASLAYDAAAGARFQAAFIGDEPLPFLPYLHPPQFLFIALVLAQAPFAAAWALFSGATMAAWVAGAAAFVRVKGAPLALAAAPAAFIALKYGQAAFLISALFTGALALLERRPLVAGALFGLMAFKPQYGVLIPLALAAGGRWRAVAAAAAMILIQIILTGAAFGWDAFALFADQASFARTAVFEGGAGAWATNFTLYGALAAWGAGPGLAYAAQAGLALFLGVRIAGLWRSGADFRLKAAGLMIAAFLATPYALEYDAVILLPPLLLLWSLGAEKGFAPFVKSLLAAAWITPLFAAPLALAAGAPAGFLAAAGLFGAVESMRALAPARVSDPAAGQPAPARIWPRLRRRGAAHG